MVSVDPSPVLPQSSKAMVLPGCLGPKVSCADSVDHSRCPRPAGWAEGISHACRRAGSGGLAGMTVPPPTPA